MPGTTARGRLRLEALDDRAVPAVFTVTTTAETGSGSLTQAILDSNNAPGEDTIAFNIPGTGVHIIALTARLPQMTGPVVIDGYTQPGSRPNTAGPGFASNGLQTIVIDGTQVLGLHPRGLVLTAGHSTVRGLHIQSFRDTGIQMFGDDNVVQGNTVDSEISLVGGAGHLVGGTTPAARNDAPIGLNSDYSRVVGNIGQVGVTGDHNVIGGTTPEERNVLNGFHTGLFISGSYNVAQGNFIGTDVTGMVRTHDANRRGGVYLDYTGHDNLIGGTTPGARNVICGSRAITIDGAADNVIQGNYVGVNAAGTGTFFNPTGIWIVSTNVGIPSNNRIGGTEPGAGNVISGNGAGIELTSAVNTRIQGNLIGVLPDGRTPAGNTQYGVRAASTAHDNLIGGTEPGAGNVIAYSRNLDGQSSGAGVEILWYAGGLRPVNGNAILGNSIFGNAGLGIDIVELNGPFGVTPNDPGDADTGGNNLQNFPVLQSATSDGAAVTVQGTLNSTPNTTFRVEVFANATADRKTGLSEGERFLGFITVTTDAAGNAAFTATFAVAVPDGQYVTATATDLGGNTSEFSRAVRVSGPRSHGGGPHARSGPNPVVLTAGGAVVIRGTPAADTVTVALDPANANLLSVYFNDPDTPAKTVNMAQTPVTRIVFRGGLGDDTFVNATGVRSVSYGGAGNDTITGGTGADQLFGGAGADSLTGGAGDDVCAGEGGSDLVDGNDGNDTLRGGFGADLVIGGPGDDHLWGGSGDDQLIGGVGDDWLDGGYGKDGVTGGPGANVVLRGDPVAAALDLWADLFDFSSFAVGFAEITVGLVDGVPHTDVEVSILDATPGDTFALSVDVIGDGSQVFDLGRITADARGTALLELIDPPGLPALLDGVSVVHATDTTPGGTTDFSGTAFDPNAVHFMANLANPADPSGPMWGSADFNANTRRLLLDFGGADANTPYTVYVGGDAATGTAVGQVTTGNNGYARLQLLAGATFPVVQEGTLVTVATAAGETIVQGALEELSGQ